MWVVILILAADILSFEELLTRSRRGDRAAVATLVTKYEREVRIVARARIGAALRPHLDSVDLVQSVHRSLLIGLRENKFEISTPEKLLALALSMVRRKVARHWRRAQRQARLSGNHGPVVGISKLLLNLSTSDEDPQSRAANAEMVQRVLSGLKEKERDLIQLRLEGYNTVDAAEKLGLDPDVTRVQLSRLRQKLRRSNIDWTLI